MSNTGFAEASVQKLPSIAYIGYVVEVPEGKLSESGNYIVQPVVVRAHSGRTMTDRILYRPEWLEASFNPDSLLEYGAEGESMLSVYRRNISVKNGVSKLKGLAGSDAGFQTLGVALIGLADKNIPAVANCLREFFLTTNEETEIGFTLKQRRDKAGEDENGRTQYELANGYEIGSYWFPTAEKVKSVVLQAKRSKDGMFKLGFEDPNA